MSAKRPVLFIHGGGEDALSFDRKIADRLQKAIGSGAHVDVPLIRGLEALNWPAVEKELGDQFRALPPGTIMVAHSIGASAVLKLLSEGLDPKLAHLFLLAPPYNGVDGEWGDGPFAFAQDFPAGLPEELQITIWHGTDDEEIPSGNSRRYAEELPKAEVHFLDGYGHQFEGSLRFLADAIREVE